MTASRSSNRSPRTWYGITLFCALLVLYHAWRLPVAWAEWHSGQPDGYPGQHRSMLLGHVTGLALALAIPLPGIMTQARDWSRGQRVALWITWGVLMAVTVVSLALDAMA